MDFSSLKSEVLTLVIDTPTAVTSLVDRFVNRAIHKAQEKHNFKVMEAEVSYTTVELTRSLGAVPSDWKEPRGKPYYVRYDGTLREIGYAASKSQAIARWGDNPDFNYGAPRLLVEEPLSGEFLVYPYPDALSDYSDGEYRLTLPYWRLLSDLQADNDENWFTNNGDDYIVAQAVADAFMANEDERRAQGWQDKAREELKDLIRRDKMRRLAEVESFVPYTGARAPHTEE